MAWVPITKQEYHRYYRTFEFVSACPKDVERLDWVTCWHKFELVDPRGNILAVEWYFMKGCSNEPKLRYDFKYPRTFYRYDKNLIEGPTDTLVPEIVDDRGSEPITTAELTLQDKYNPKARFFSVLAKLQERMKSNKPI